MVRTKRSANAFRLGERAGSRTGATPPATASASVQALLLSGTGCCRCSVRRTTS